MTDKMYLPVEVPKSKPSRKQGPPSIVQRALYRQSASQPPLHDHITRITFTQINGGELGRKSATSSAIDSK